MEIFCKTCKYFDNPCKCVDCQEDDGHLYEKADWAKRYDKQIKADAIDEFSDKIKWFIDENDCFNTPNIDNKMAIVRRGFIDELAEKMKEKNNGGI